MNRAAIILVTELLGAGTVSVGAGLIFVPAGIIVAGIFLLVFAFAFERSRA
jgi:hypothetical protein